jgi:uncharacterized membrane protein
MNMSYFKHKFKLIDNILNDWLGDLKSLRVVLILFAYAWNVFVIWMCVSHGLDYKVSITSIGLLSAIYLFFYASKSQQATIENQQASNDTSEDDK